MRTSLRLGYITEWFPPEPGGAPLWIARAMRDQGFDVGVVTGVPHYPSGLPASGYSWHTSRRESIDGFPVLRVPEYPSHDQSVIRRAVTYGSFSLASAALGTRFLGQANVCLVYASPATAALAAMVAHRRYQVPYVLLVQDLWPDSMLTSGFLGNGIARRTFGLAAHEFVDATYRGASHVAVISPGMRSAVMDRGVPGAKISTVYNWVDEETLAPRRGEGELRRRAGLSDADFVLLYAGNQGEAQGLSVWVEAVSQLDDCPQVHLVLMGDGTQKSALVAQAHQMGVSRRVHFLPPVSLDEVARMTADADVCVVALRDEPLYRITMPSKLQAVMAQGKPVLCSVPGDATSIVERAGAGWVARSDDAASMASAVREALSSGPRELASRGCAGREFYLAHMSRSVGSEKLAKVLRDASREGRPPSRTRKSNDGS